MGVVWIVLSDGKKAQVYEKQASGESAVIPLFEAPLNCCQLLHEIRWHYGDVASDCSLVEALRALLVNAALKGRYQSLILVAPPEISVEIKTILPETLKSRIVRSIEKDLTHCHREGISSYFAQLV